MSVRRTTRAACLAAVLGAACAGAAFLGAASPAPAADGDRIDFTDPGVKLFPSGDVPSEAALANVVNQSTTHTLVFDEGTQLLSNTLLVFRRKGLRIVGRTGRAEDVVLDSDGRPVLRFIECEDIEIADLTIRPTPPAGTATSLQFDASFGSEFQGFCRDLVVRNCRLEGGIPVSASVDVENLVVDRCRFVQTQSGGASLRWNDGRGLFVNRCTFDTADGVTGIAAILVQGVGAAGSEGERARTVQIAGNRCEGDFSQFARLNDVFDAVVRGNRIEYDEPTDAGGGARVGVFIARNQAADVSQLCVVRRNRIRGAHTAIVVSDVLRSQDDVREFGARIERNDLRGSGSPVADATFGDTGAALRGLNLSSVRFDDNDLRSFRAPAGAAPVRVGGILFLPNAPTGNRIDAGRPLTDTAGDP